MSQPKTEKFTR